jgi:hypothetical protein
MALLARSRRKGRLLELGAGALWKIPVICERISPSSSSSSSSTLLAFFWHEGGRK